MSGLHLKTSNEEEHITSLYLSQQPCCSVWKFFLIISQNLPFFNLNSLIHVLYSAKIENSADHFCITFLPGFEEYCHIVLLVLSSYDYSPSFFKSSQFLVNHSPIRMCACLSDSFLNSGAIIF